LYNINEIKNNETVCTLAISMYVDLLFYAENQIIFWKGGR